MKSITLSLAMLASASAAGAQTAAPIGSPGDVPVLTTTATGVQVYECKASSAGALEWTFKEPRADLFVGKEKVIRHFAGPSWEYSDGSRIVGKVAAKQNAPGSDDIPWLRLSVASRSGSGTLSDVTAVQRIDTHGGVKSGGCDQAGAVSEVPYTATYTFLREAK
ncbi:DUF3455 domain-containing protein [Methylobacterium brachythecii]|uniref:DUF3455 domain-containing protein n=1 Tax=Methylobacterium brachythecii TaxID=1176177 RepID=A0A7W6F5X8_9HYPH|nr:DUF3455 domain-containing protein [Methylobacterium brachythecii]MBB3901820.1 hypothetical protein [Methylobacterium brachythecii]GLS43199.1 hypothetical protein GCM10007884_11840 [Methylobacterium brachythecii]